MRKFEIKIAEHIKNKNGLTNKQIASLSTGYAISTCKRVFLKMTYKENDHYYLTQAGIDALNIEHSARTKSV